MLEFVIPPKIPSTHAYEDTSRYAPISGLLKELKEYMGMCIYINKEFFSR